jgi:hypothetical protein
VEQPAGQIEQHVDYEEADDESDTVKDEWRGIPIRCDKSGERLGITDGPDKPGKEPQQRKHLSE